MSMRQLTSRSTIGSASSVPSQDILVSRSEAADERSLRANDEHCSRDRRQRLVGIVVAVVAICAAILVAAAIVRVGRMKSDGAASPSGRGDALPASRETTHPNVRASAVANVAPPRRWAPPAAARASSERCRFAFASGAILFNSPC